ncbi:MAG: hypothetical protein R6X12_02280 [bacterium]
MSGGSQGGQDDAEGAGRMGEWGEDEVERRRWAGTRGALNDEL